MLPEPISVTVQVTNLFEQLHIPYFLGGSFASAIHGVVRTTQDSDILAEMDTVHIPEFLNALGADFYVDEKMIADAIQRQSTFNIIHQESMFKVDIFISKKRPFENSQLSRAQKQQLSEEPPTFANVCTAEDIILAKIEWFRLGGETSERQWRDVLGIIKIQRGRLDLGYLKKWATELKINDLLENALQDI